MFTPLSVTTDVSNGQLQMQNMLMDFVLKESMESHDKSRGNPVSKSSFLIKDIISPEPNSEKSIENGPYPCGSPNPAMFHPRLHTVPPIYPVNPVDIITRHDINRKLLYDNNYGLPLHNPIDLSMIGTPPFMKSPAPHSLLYYYKSLSRESERVENIKRCRRSRTVFTDSQLIGLDKSFKHSKYLNTPERNRLAKHLGLTQTQVKTWYQNRRMKWKKQLIQDGATDIPTKPKGRPRKTC